MLTEIEIYARENYVPIMQKEAMLFINNFVKKNNIKTILEIGSAIGYSAINMALVDSDIKVVTIERDKERYEEALKNIQKFHLEDRITIYNMDAFEFECAGNFDMLLIDAAKSQNKRFFEKFEKHISKYILTDNLHFHGLVFNHEAIKSKNVRQMVKKIEDYIAFLEKNQTFQTTIYDIGDGIGVSIRKGEL